MKQKTHFCLLIAHDHNNNYRDIKYEEEKKNEYCNENEEKKWVQLLKLAGYAAEFRPFTFYSVYTCVCVCVCALCW